MSNFRGIKEDDRVWRGTRDRLDDTKSRMSTPGSPNSHLPRVPTPERLRPREGCGPRDGLSIGGSGVREVGDPEGRVTSGTHGTRTRRRPVQRFLVAVSKDFPRPKVLRTVPRRVLRYSTVKGPTHEYRLGPESPEGEE